MGKGDSFQTRTFHIGHLVLWYSVLSVGIAYFFFYHFKNPLYLLIISVAVIMTVLLYVDFANLSMFKRRGNEVATPTSESSPQVAAAAMTATADCHAQNSETDTLRSDSAICSHEEKWSPWKNSLSSRF
jgi:hypothetical protein